MKPNPSLVARRAVVCCCLSLPAPRPRAVTARPAAAAARTPAAVVGPPAPVPPDPLAAAAPGVLAVPRESPARAGTRERADAEARAGAPARQPAAAPSREPEVAARAARAAPAVRSGSRARRNGRRGQNGRRRGSGGRAARRKRGRGAGGAGGSGGTTANGGATGTCALPTTFDGRRVRSLSRNPVVSLKDFSSRLQQPAHRLLSIVDGAGLRRRYDDLHRLASDGHHTQTLPYGGSLTLIYSPKTSGFSCTSGAQPRI